MPQIDQVIVSYASQIAWLVLVLAVIYFGIAKAMLPKVQDTIDARARRISDDLAAADKAHEEADRIEEDYRTRINEARARSHAVTSEAKAEAARASEQRLAAAEGQHEARLAEAEARLAEKRKAALAEIEDVAADATRDIVARIAGGQVDEAEACSTVKEVMAHG